MDTVTILGARGSIPRAGREFARYGGDTTCILVRMAGETILLDAGTGLLHFDPPPSSEDKPIPLLLSHFHMDHLLGLSLSPLLMDTNNHVDIYAQSRAGLDAEERMERIYSPPIWPVSLELLPAWVNYRELQATLRFGEVSVETAEDIHPDGVTLMRLTHGERSVVFLTDCTLTEEIFPKLAEFSRGCDLLLCDGQYSDEEWKKRSAFGHSTWNRAVELGLACGAKKIRIVHHDPFHTDRMLDKAASQLAARHPDCSFARDREEIEL